MNNPSNSNEFPTKFLQNPENGQNGNGIKRGSYKARGKTNDALCAIESAQGRLVEVIKRESLTTEEILRNVSLALHYLGGSITLINESDQAWTDFVSEKERG